jgi:hypothetical protein
MLKSMLVKFGFLTGFCGLNLYLEFSFNRTGIAPTERVFPKTGLFVEKNRNIEGSS